MLFILLLLAVGTHAAQLAKQGVISQYWAAYATGEQPPNAFPWSTADIANYFVVVTTSGAASLEVPFPQTTSDIYAFVQQAKANNVKPVVSIGGWTGGKYFSSLVATQSSRTSFVGKIQAFVNTYGFDGVDIDWEYPNYLWNGNEINDADSQNLLFFLQQLRTSLGPNPILSMAASMSGLIGPQQAPVQNLAQYAQYLDYLNLMAYDVTGSWSQKSGPNAPMSTCGADTSIKRALDIWRSRGFPASKILLGLPSYAISFTAASSTLAVTNVNDGSNNFASKFYQEKVGISPSSQCGGSSGYCNYKKMIGAGILTANGDAAIAPFQRYFDQCTSVPFVFNPQTRELITYDDSTSAGIKSLFARQQGLAGMMVFDSNGFDGRVYAAVRSGLAGTFVPTATSPEPVASVAPTSTSTTTTRASTTTVASTSSTLSTMTRSSSAVASTSTTSSSAVVSTSTSTSSTPSSTPLSSSTPLTTSTPLTSTSLAASSTSSSTPAPTTTLVTRTARVVCNSSSVWSLCGSRCSPTATVPTSAKCVSGVFSFISNRQTVRSINCLTETSWQLVSTTGVVSGTGITPKGVVCRSGAFVAVA